MDIIENKIHKILVVRIGNIGDVLMITPLIRSLRRNFPDAKIDIVTSLLGKYIFENNPYVDEILVARKYSRIIREQKKRMFLRECLRRKYDVIFLLEISPNYVEMFSQIQAKSIIGFENSTKKLHRSVEFKFDRHNIENNLSLLKLLGLKINGLKMDFFITDIDKKRARRYLQSIRAKDKIFVISPNCTEGLPLRLWPLDRFAEVADRLVEKYNATIILSGANKKTDIQRTKVVFNMMSHKPNLFLGKDFKIFAALVSFASAFIGLDSGPLHLAHALNIPVLGLFGPSSPTLTGLISGANYLIIRKDFRCGPCNFFLKKPKEECLNSQFTPCMKSITVGDVLKAMEILLKMPEGR